MIYTAEEARAQSQTLDEPIILEWETTIQNIMAEIHDVVMGTPLSVKDYIIVSQCEKLKNDRLLTQFVTKWNTSMFSNWKRLKYYQLSEKQQKIVLTLEELGYRLEFVKIGTVGLAAVPFEPDQYELSLKISWSR